MDINIGVVGSSNAGKTVYLATLLRLLFRPDEPSEQSDATLIDLSAAPDDPDTWTFWTGFHAMLDAGRWPPKNAPGYQRAIRFKLTDGRGEEHHVHFRDLAGEDVARVLVDPNDPDLGPVRAWYEQCSAFLFLIAPTHDRGAMYASVDDLRVPADDPQVLFMNRLVELIGRTAATTAGRGAAGRPRAAAGAKVRQPTAFVFTCSDQFADASGRQGALAKKVFARPELISGRFTTYEFFWCTSTGPLDRAVRQDPRPRKGQLEPRNVVEPLDWVLGRLRAQRDHAAADGARQRRRRIVLRSAAAAAVVVGAAGAFGGLQYRGNVRRLDAARGLIDAARGNPADAAAARTNLDAATRALSGMSGLGANVAERARLARAAGQLAVAQDARATSEAVARIARAVTAADVSPAEAAALARDLTTAVDAAARARAAAGTAPDSVDADARRQLDESAKQLAGDLEAALRLALRAPTPATVKPLVGVVARWSPGAAGTPAAADAAAADRARYVGLIADAVAAMDPKDVPGAGGPPAPRGPGGDVFEASADVCRGVFDRLCPRYVEAGGGDPAARRVRQTLGGLVAALGERNRVAVRAHAAHVRARNLVDAAGDAARGPAVLASFDQAWDELAAERDPAADALRADAAAGFVKMADGLLADARQQLAGGRRAEAAAAADAVAAAARASKLFAPAGGPAPAANRRALDAALLNAARAVPAADLGDAQVWPFCRALCGAAAGEAESPVVDAVASALARQGRFASAATFVKGLPARAWRDARLAAVTAAAGEFTGRIEAAYLAPAASPQAGGGGAGGRRLNVEAVRSGPAAFLQAVDAMDVFVRDAERYPAGSLPEFGARLAAGRDLQAILLAGGTARAATPDGRAALAAALRACERADTAAARQAVERLSRFDRIQLARDVARVQSGMVPALDRLAEAARAPNRAQRLAGYARAADELDRLSAPDAATAGGASPPAAATRPAAADEAAVDVAASLRVCRDAAVRRARDELAAWGLEVQRALPAGRDPAAVAPLLAQVVGTDADAALRTRDGTGYAGVLADLAGRVRQAVASRAPGPVTAGERPLLLAAAASLPQRGELFAALFDRCGAAPDGLLAAAALLDEATADARRRAAAAAGAAAVAAQAQRELAAAGADLRARAVAAVAAFTERYAPGGVVDRRQVDRACFGKARQAALLREQQGVADVHRMAVAHDAYPADQRERPAAVLSAIARAAEAAETCIPLMVGTDPRDQRRTIGFTPLGAGGGGPPAGGAAAAGPLPVALWIEGADMARYDASTRAIGELLRQAARAASADEVDRLLSVEPAAGGERAFRVMLKGCKDPLVVVDRNSYYTFAYVYGTREKRDRGLYNERVVAEWYRFLFAETVKVVTCQAEPSAAAPARLKALAADVRKLGPDAVPDAVRQVIAQYSDVAKPREFDLPADFHP